MYGLLAEDDSDVQTLARIIRRLACNSALSIRGVGYDGCAALLRKGARELRNLTSQGCTRFVICYDADGPDGAVRRQVVTEQIIVPSGLPRGTCLSLVPVQEIEAWILADADHAISHLIRSWRPEEVQQPENVQSPKEELARRSRDSMRRPRYSYTTHNPQVATYLDLDRVARKCASFRPLTAFVTDNRPLHPPQRSAAEAGRGVRIYANHGDTDCADVGLLCAPHEWAEFTLRVGVRLVPSPLLQHLCCFGWSEVPGLGAELDVLRDEVQPPTVRMVAETLRQAVAYHPRAQQIGFWDGLSHRCPVCELNADR